MIRWELVQFGELYAIPSRNGLMRPSGVRGTGYKMVNMGELYAYPRMKNPNMERVRLSQNDIDRFGVIEGDLLFARQSLVAEGAGKSAIVLEIEQPACFESHLIRVRLNRVLADPVFYFYYFRSETGHGAIQSLVNQVSAAGIRGSDLERLKVIYPSLPVQRKIAAVLSAYDDLIENNNRRIAILEKMAEEIYREWFVRMRFPGHEKTKFHKGVPEGWQYFSCSSVLHVLSGGTPRTEVSGYWNGDIPFFTPKDAGNGFYVLDTEKHLTEDGLRSCNSALYEKNTIFITARGTVGKIVLSCRSMAMNQSCYALAPKSDKEIYFYFLALRDSIKYIKGISKSGVFDNIIIDTFAVVPLLTPSEDLVKRFNDLVKPSFEHLGLLMTSNARLGANRDLLISRLITGKLSVEDLDIKFPTSMRDPEFDEGKEGHA